MLTKAIEPATGTIQKWLEKLDEFTTGLNSFGKALADILGETGGQLLKLHGLVHQSNIDAQKYAKTAGAIETPVHDKPLFDFLQKNTDPNAPSEFAGEQSALN